MAFSYERPARHEFFQNASQNIVRGSYNEYVLRGTNELCYQTTGRTRQLSLLPEGGKPSTSIKKL